MTIWRSKVKRFGLIIIVCIIGVLGILIGMSCDNLTSSSIAYKGERIGLIHVEGVITATKDDEISTLTFGGGASSEKLVQQLDEARKDSNIKAVVMRINSPGGSAAGSQEIYNAIKNYRTSGKKLIVSIGDIAASGGYYIASPSDIIYANPSSLTGSIGVIIQLLNYEGLFDKIGLDEITLKAGKYKDIGNPNRPMTEEEKKILENLLTDVHSMFKEAVMEGRGFTKEQIDALATGEIWTGRQAKEKKLVDEMGGLKDALDRAAKEAGLDPENYVVSPLGEMNIIDEILKGFDFNQKANLAIDPLQTLGRILFLNPIAARMVIR
jgi:protease-4